MMHLTRAAVGFSGDGPEPRHRVQIVNADDRILLLDLENLGSTRLRPRLLRARLGALLAAAGEIHHAVAAYSMLEMSEDDPLASLLAELRIAPLRVAPGADAAELALLAHSRYTHAAGGRIFIVASADGRFAELASLGRVELLVWDGQPVATRLAEVAHDMRRVARPTGASMHDATEHDQPATSTGLAATPPARSPHQSSGEFVGQLMTSIATGVGIALAHRLLDVLLRRWKP